MTTYIVLGPDGRVRYRGEDRVLAMDLRVLVSGVVLTHVRGCAPAGDSVSGAKSDVL